MASDTQIEKMEKELARMRAAMTENVQLMEQREINTNLEYESLTVKAAALREDLHTEIEHIINSVVQFKLNIQDRISKYEEFISIEDLAQMEQKERMERGEELVDDLTEDNMEQ
jgi:kinetochore protein NDC80